MRVNDPFSESLSHDVQISSVPVAETKPVSSKSAAPSLSKTSIDQLSIRSRSHRAPLVIPSNLETTVSTLHCEKDADFIPHPKRPRSSADLSSEGLALAGRIADLSSSGDMPIPSSRIRTSQSPFSRYEHVMSTCFACATILLSTRSAKAPARS